MSTFLWQSIAFGPIYSRRLGQSLGLNLQPTETKICSFNCVYCECGETFTPPSSQESEYIPTREILEAIESKLIDCQQKEIIIDTITFAGNGEPTLHPGFATIIDGLLKLRQQYYPNAGIACLSNSTQLHRADVRDALKNIERPILKLDADSDDLIQLINQPMIPITHQEIMENLKKMNGYAIIQTLFFKGKIRNKFYDNSTEENITRWLANLEEIAPKSVMIYSLDRDTPHRGLKKIPLDKLEQIAQRVKEKGFETSVY